MLTPMQEAAFELIEGVRKQLQTQTREEVISSLKDALIQQGTSTERATIGAENIVRVAEKDTPH